MAGTKTKLQVLDPTAESTTGEGSLSPRLGSLAGKTLGVLWNGRPAGDRILDRMIGLLKERDDLGEVVFRRKPYLGNLAPPELFDELVASCDAVVTGVGD